MKRLLSKAILSVSLLTLSYANVSNATTPLDATVRCEVSKIIIGVLANPTIAHPYRIVEVLILKMRLLLSQGNNPSIASLCARLESAIANKSGALMILSILQETAPLLSPEALARLEKLSQGERMTLLAKFSKQIKQAPQGTIESVAALFRC